jgi:hypothetical protein
VLLCLFVGACADGSSSIAGRWHAESATLISVEFNSDGQAAVVGTGFLDLKWRHVDPGLVRIQALDGNLVANFRIRADELGKYGVLELGGFESLTFRKAE